MGVEIVKFSAVVLGDFNASISFTNRIFILCRNYCYECEETNAMELKSFFGVRIVIETNPLVLDQNKGCASFQNRYIVIT